LSELYNDIKEKSEIKPFLRWVGGKKWLIKNIDKFLPSQFNNYYEPFLGGGSVFFFLSPSKKSYLSDLNSDLVNTYIQIRDNVENVIKALKIFKNTKEDYYVIRVKKFKSEHKKAAKFTILAFVL